MREDRCEVPVEQALDQGVHGWVGGGEQRPEDQDDGDGEYHPGGDGGRAAGSPSGVEPAPVTQGLHGSDGHVARDIGQSAPVLGDIRGAERAAQVHGDGDGSGGHRHQIPGLKEGRRAPGEGAGEEARGAEQDGQGPGGPARAAMQEPADPRKRADPQRDVEADLGPIEQQVAEHTEAGAENERGDRQLNGTGGADFGGVVHPDSSHCFGHGHKVLCVTKLIRWAGRGKKFVADLPAAPDVPE